MRRPLVSAVAVVVLAASSPCAFSQCEVGGLAGVETIAFDAFGTAVDIDGDVLVVGSPGADVGAGAAYVYRRAGAQWVQEARLTLPGASPNDAFGSDVAVDGNILVVGAPAGQGAAAGTGAAAVYEFDGSNWAFRQTIFAPDGAGQDSFGGAVAVSGDYIVVGAYGDDDGANLAGSAYVFVHSGSPAAWTMQQKLAAPVAGAGDQFGWSVDIDGDTLVIGANLDDEGSTDAGSAYVFDRAGATWGFTVRLGAGDAAAADFFGQSVSISGDAILVGAVNGDGVEGNSGSAYVFRRTAGVWAEEDELTAVDGQAQDFFGTAVSLDGDIALIGARGDDDLANRAGAAYVFRRSAGLWSQVDKLTASDATADDFFGASVAVSGGRAVVGSILGESMGMNSGSAYAFVLDGPDCNENGAPDECDIASGLEADADNDGVPDSCQSTCVCERDGADGVNVFDLLAYLDDWFASTAAADVDGVAGVDVFDLLFFLDCWFPASAGGC